MSSSIISVFLFCRTTHGIYVTISFLLSCLSLQKWQQFRKSCKCIIRLMRVIVGVTIWLGWVFFFYQFPTSGEWSTHARFRYRWGERERVEKRDVCIYLYDGVVMIILLFSFQCAILQKLQVSWILHLLYLCPTVSHGTTNTN